jgi:RNA polymerase sigma-32 factor
LLEQLKEHLNDKERMILEERLLTDEPMMLQNIADKFDISRERVRQIEVNLLAKMKKYLESEMPDIVDFFDGEKIIVNASD